MIQKDIKYFNNFRSIVQNEQNDVEKKTYRYLNGNYDANKLILELSATVDLYNAYIHELLDELTNLYMMKSEKSSSSLDETLDDAEKYVKQNYDESI